MYPNVSEVVAVMRTSSFLGSRVWGLLISRLKGYCLRVDGSASFFVVVSPVLLSGALVSVFKNVKRACVVSYLFF